MVVALVVIGASTAQAGTLTLSLNRQWVESAAACRADDYAPALYAYVYVNGVSQFISRNQPAVRRCYGSADPPYMPTTASVPVVAGQEVRFEVGMQDQTRDMTGRGAVMTVRFEPTR